MADVAAAPADGAQKARPEKPDEEKFKAKLAEAEKAHEAAMARFNATKTKLDTARPGKDSPANDRFKALVAEQNEIREKQRANKTSRTAQQQKFDSVDKEIKKLIQDQKDARGRAGFKSVAEIDAEIDRLDKQVDSGALKIVDEKKNLAEISNLRRQRKGFSGFDDAQKTIDQKRTENAELRKTFDNPESRALSQKYEDNQKELDDIKASREGANKNFDTLKAEREQAYEGQRNTYSEIKKVKDDYYAQKKAFKEHEDLLFQQRRERQKSERDAYEKEKRKKIAAEKLEEASEPAYLDEIRTAEGLIRHFDPSSAVTETDQGPGKFAASAQRTIDESGFKGMKVMKKEEEDFFTGNAGKKKGKGKKTATNGTAAAPDSGRYNLNMGVIEQLNKVGVEPPSTQADVAGVVEKLKEKLATWKSDQESQTKKNIDKAQKEIERLEKEAAEAPAPSSPPPKGNNRRRGEERGKKNASKDSGANSKEEDATAGVTKDLKETSIENKEKAAVEA